MEIGLPGAQRERASSIGIDIAPWLSAERSWGSGMDRGCCAKGNPIGCLPFGCSPVAAGPAAFFCIMPWLLSSRSPVSSQWQNSSKSSCHVLGSVSKISKVAWISWCMGLIYGGVWRRGFQNCVSLQSLPCAAKFTIAMEVVHPVHGRSRALEKQRDHIRTNKFSQEYTACVWVVLLSLVVAGGVYIEENVLVSRCVLMLVFFHANILAEMPDNWLGSLQTWFRLPTVRVTRCQHVATPLIVLAARESIHT